MKIDFYTLHYSSWKTQRFKMPRITFRTIKKTLIIPKKENPVSSAQTPNMPPMFAIWSDKAYRDSRIVISTLDDGNFM